MGVMTDPTPDMLAAGLAALCEASEAANAKAGSDTINRAFCLGQATAYENALSALAKHAPLSDAGER